MTFKDRCRKIIDWYRSPLTAAGWKWNLLAVLLAALLLRIFLALPALQDPAMLLRPDSMGYWNPACALAAGDGYVSLPGSTALECVRPIGYPAFLALPIWLLGNKFLYGALAGILLGSLTLLPIAGAVRKLAGERAGIAAAWLYALNITAIADAPLILSDTLLGFIAAWQLWMIVRFLQDKNFAYFAGFALFAIIGVAVKPVNLPVVLIGLPVLSLAGMYSAKDFFCGIGIAAVLSGILLVPYWIYNYRLCGDIDGNTANSYFHNGSAIMAGVTGESSEIWRKKLLEKADKEFAAHPEKYQNNLKAQNQWKKARFAEMIRQYPRETIITHLPNVFNLLPDVPSLLENNRVTTGERGTMAVLRQKGFFAAVDHYLDGRWQVLLWLLPLLGIYALTLLLALVRLFIYIVKWQWRWLLVFGVMVFYYLWAPGPVISARYLLPALPMLLLMSVQCKNIQEMKGYDYEQ